jgi:hypothetical protein
MSCFIGRVELTLHRRNHHEERSAVNQVPPRQAAPSSAAARQAGARHGNLGRAILVRPIRGACLERGQQRHQRALGQPVQRPPALPGGRLEHLNNIIRYIPNDKGGRKRQ